MTQRDINVYLWDIKQACLAILSFTDGKTRDDYDPDEMLKSAVERQLILLGEALNRAVAIDPTLRAGISQVPQIINLRHRLVHDYQRTNHEIVWDIITSHIPLLLADVDGRLTEEPPLKYF